MPEKALMKKTLTTVVVIFILGLCASGADAAGVPALRIQAWTPSPALPRVPMDLTPTLPAPGLVREPEFTWGLTNTLHWSTDSVLLWLRPLNMTLLFFEIQASAQGREWWGFVDAGVDSATFENLPEGVPMEFRLRYYARDASGTYFLSRWSEPQKSIQDNHLPLITGWNIAKLQQTRSGNWVEGRTVAVHLSAVDTSGGKIMEAVIRESGAGGDHVLLFDFQHPQTRVDTTLIYSIHAPPNSGLRLSLQIRDVSGQSSIVHSIDFFWWQGEGTPAMVCFPNPFRPDRDQLSTIKVGEDGANEALIFDPFGNQVRILTKNSDQLFFEWDGKNGRGEIVSNGAYLCVLKNNQRQYCKIMVRK
jgi:hypothetical protein